MSLIVFDRPAMEQISAQTNAILGGQIADAQARMGEVKIELAAAQAQLAMAEAQLMGARDALMALTGTPPPVRW